MWTRSLLKQNAKDALRGRYWRSFALCLILSLFGIGSCTPQFRTTYDMTTEQLEEAMHGAVWFGDAQAGYDALLDTIEQYALVPWIIFITLAAILVGFCWSVFITAPLTVGRNRYFMESRQSPAPMGTVLTVFRTPYLNVVKVSLLVSLKIGLGCLLIIPGIYWAFCYLMVPYLLAENPYLTTGRAMELSRAMMEGEKIRAFVLSLSFIGWELLCALTLGFGFFFLEPYYQATIAELYAALRSKAFALNLTDQQELCGFVDHTEDFNR